MLESLDPTKVIIAILNVILLYVVLRKILFKPVTRFMDNRAKSIRDSIDEADRQKAEAAELKQKYEAQLRAAREEGEKIIAEARSKAEKEREALAAAARQEAEGILARAREEIRYEREQMQNEVRTQVAVLALAAASRVIEANLDTESNRVLVEKFISEEGAA